MKNNIWGALIFGICISIMGCDKDCDDHNDGDGNGNLSSYTETLQPSNVEGKDAFVYDLEPDRNFETHPDFMAASGTNGGVQFIVRSFVRFDFASIPSDAIIDSVKLSLFSYNSASNGSHFWGEGSNRSFIQKVNSPWSESLITWNNQPSSSEENKIVLQQSENEIQDYLDIDVTVLAKEMIKTPSVNNGFVIKLETEEIYKRMVFGSSDNDNDSLYPKLVVYYSR